jgi:uncharacterized protein (DUF2267 family)
MTRHELLRLLLAELEAKTAAQLWADRHGGYLCLMARNYGEVAKAAIGTMLEEDFGTRASHSTVLEHHVKGARVVDAVFSLLVEQVSQTWDTKTAEERRTVRITYLQARLQMPDLPIEEMS